MESVSYQSGSEMRSARSSIQAGDVPKSRTGLGVLQLLLQGLGYALIGYLVWLGATLAWTVVVAVAQWLIEYLWFVVAGLIPFVGVLYGLDLVARHRGEP